MGIESVAPRPSYRTRLYATRRLPLFGPLEPEQQVVGSLGPDVRHMPFRVILGDEPIKNACMLQIEA